MLIVYIIFILSLVLAEKMWNFSEELRIRNYGRKVELLTMIAGCIILGIGEGIVTYNHVEFAVQQEEFEETFLAYIMWAFLAGVQLVVAADAMKKYKRISDKLIIFGTWLFCLLVGWAIALI